MGVILCVVGLIVGWIMGFGLEGFVYFMEMVVNEMLSFIFSKLFRCCMCVVFICNVCGYCFI